MDRIAWTAAAWKDYLYWQSQDRKRFRRINRLIRDTQRSLFSGIGKPEALKENLAGLWSRRIDDTHRLVYTVEDSTLVILSCRYHY